MNAQVDHIEGEERKINKSNNMIMKPHHRLRKVYTITIPVKCLYARITVYYTLVVCYHAQSKWEKGNTKRREGS